MKTNSPISSRELERRWIAMRQVMEELGLDAILMQAREDWIGGYVRWFTDVPAGNGYPRTVIFFADRPMVVIEMGAFGSIRTTDASAQATYGVGQAFSTPSFHSVDYTVDYDTDLAIRVLEENNATRVGAIVPAALPHGMISALSNVFEIVNATDAIDRVKAVKSAEEIALIRQTACMQDQIFAEVCDYIRPGISDREVSSYAEAVGRRLGADQGVYLGVSAPLGQPSRFMGRPFQTREIANGDHMSLLIEVNGPGGLYLELGRTMVLGKADKALLSAFADVKAAQEYSLSLMLPGAFPADIAAAHNKWMTEHGLPMETRLYAHGQGCDMVERPLIRHDETMALAENMCLAVHPGYENDKLFAVICDNYLIGADGPGECLHRTEKKIFEL